MASPRHLSRRDRPHCAHIRHPPFPEKAGSFGSRAIDDPDRLIEDAFAGRASMPDPLDAVLAWMACVPPDVDIPAAAFRLFRRLQARPKPLMAWQKQLIGLLNFIALHRRVPSAQALEIRFRNKDKGQP
jgi:hypothetical protein